MSSVCRLCGGTHFEALIDFGMMPIAHRMPTDPHAPEEMFPFAAHYCTTCGLPQLIKPISAKILYSGYNFNFSSWKPEPHLADELDLLMSIDGLDSVLEIGCNDGRFLAGLAERGVARTIGLEMNPVPAAVARQRGLTVFEGPVSAALATQAVAQSGKVKLMMARQVFEHLHGYDDFFAAADAALESDGWLFLDVPDFEPALIAGDCSVFWEEHVSYFTQSTLSRVLRRYGFEPVTWRRYNFSGGTLAVLARRTSAATADKFEEISPLLNTYNQRVGVYRQALRTLLAGAQAQSRATVLYGVGCRACTLVNGLGLGDLLDHVVDDQVERHGRLMPGIKKPVQPSDILVDLQGAVVVMAVNNENDDKVRGRITALQPRIGSVLSSAAPAAIDQELLIAAREIRIHD